MFSFFPGKSKSKKERSSLRKSDERRLAVENLEDRRVLSATTMTDYEQLILELVNRARMDPLAEVARNSSVGSLNQGVSSGSITSTPKQPLASVQPLVDSGRAHAQDMIDNDYFSHYGLDASTPTSRGAAAGYWNSVGENIAWNGSTGPIDHESETYTAHENLFASPSHRVNMLHDPYSEVGIGVRFGPYTDGLTYNVAMTAEQFGFKLGSNPYITGVVYEDGRTIDDDFYSIGESEENVRITALSMNTGLTYTTTTGASGGYNLTVPSGTYTLTASDGLSETMVETMVVVTSENVKVDFDSSEATGNKEDIIGFNSSEHLWVGESNGSTLDTSKFGEFPSNTTYHFVSKGDFNGDGLDDMVGHMSNGKLKVAISTGMSSFIIADWGNVTSSIAWSDYNVGDFDGDGMDDVLFRTETNGTWWVAKSDGNGFSNNYWGSYTPGIEWTFFVGDFSGDNVTDIAGRAGNGTWWIGTSTGTHFTNSYWGKWNTGSVWHDISVGDFNGDGRDDIAGRANNEQWWVAVSDGTNFDMEHWASWTKTVEWVDVSVGDFDGDGDDDIAGRGLGQWWIASSNGADGFNNQFWGYWTTSTTWSGVRILDLNGDGRDDIIGRAANGQWWIFESSGSGFGGRLVAKWSPGSTWNYIGVGNFS